MAGTAEYRGHEHTLCCQRTALCIEKGLNRSGSGFLGTDMHDGRFHGLAVQNRVQWRTDHPSPSATTGQASAAIHRASALVKNAQR